MRGKLTSPTPTLQETGPTVLRPIREDEFFSLKGILSFIFSKLCTHIHVNKGTFERNSSLVYNITWPEMGLQDMQAKEVYWYNTAFGLLLVIQKVQCPRNFDHRMFKTHILNTTSSCEFYSCSTLWPLTLFLVQRIWYWIN